MTQQNPNQAANGPSLLDVVGSTAALAGSLFLASACTSEIPMPGPTASPTAEDVLKELPRGACLPTPFESQRIAAATRCLAVQEAGRVTIVGFGNALVTDTIARRVEATVNRATLGRITVRVETVPASDAAERRFATTVGGRGCVDSTKPKEFASVAADLEMPKLREDADFVVGVTNQKACTSSINGAADQAHGRDADIFAADKIVDQLRDGSAEDDEADTIAHELLHLYQLGHAGTLSGHDDQSDGYIGFDGHDRYTIGHDIDLKAYCADSFYREYGEHTGVMGDGIGIPLSNVPPNPLHLNEVLEPRVVLGKAKPDAQSMSGEWTRFRAGQGATNSLAVAKLAEPMTFTDKGISNVTHEQTGKHTFDTLAFVPQYDQNGSIWGVEVYLYDSRGANSASLGIMSRPRAGTATSRIMYGTQVFEVRSNRSDLEVRTVTAGQA